MSRPKSLAYLLRGWEERSDEGARRALNWRFSLEDPHTGRVRGFASLEKLMAALERQLDEEERE